MEKVFNIVRWCVNIILGFGSLLVLNENPDDLTPNFVGFICIALLIAINKDSEK